MEIEIKHVNFFDGQFLQQSEFIEEQLYHMHMRRRLYLALFEQDGVIPVAGSDLTIVPDNLADPLNKSFRVRAGMAISLDLAAMERKEIILRQDSAVINLNTLGFPGAGPTAWVAIHYDEQGVALPPSAGDVPGNTRILENAPITVHASDPTGTNAPNGHPFIVLGAITVGNMNVNLAQRQVARLRGSLIASTPTISISPNTLPPTGVNIDIIVTSAGGLNLSTATAASIAFSNPAGIAIVSVTNQTATGMTVRINLTNAAPGPRAMTVTVNAVSASASFTVQAGLQLTGFAGIDEPIADLLFKINGSGFASPVIVEFSASGGGFTTPIPLAAGNVTLTQITIPNSQIPANATLGPVRVQSGGNPTITSAFNVMPPPVLTTVPTSGTTQTNIIITGSRFFTGTSVTLPGNQVRGPASPTPFPSVAFLETLTETQIVVRLVSNAGTSGRVRVTTAGGTVQSAANLVVSN